MSYLGKIERKPREKTNPQLVPLRQQNCKEEVLASYQTIVGQNQYTVIMGCHIKRQPTVCISLRMITSNSCTTFIIICLPLSNSLRLQSPFEQEHCNVEGADNILARLDDIEIIILHYRREQEAKENGNNEARELTEKTN